MNPLPPKANILVVEDQASMRKLIEDYLRSKNFFVASCESADAALAILQLPSAGFEIGAQRLAAPRTPAASDETGEFDAILTDITMPGMSGLEFCAQIKKFRPDLPVIVMTAYGSLETSIEAIRAGAFDFVTKPVELELLNATLSRATEHTSLKRQIKLLEARARGTNFEALIGESDVMRKLKSQLERVVKSNVSVLLTGESGTGKEVVAQSLHSKSDRAARPFIAVNCAALPETLLESELFGHTRGAFTDARDDRTGLFLQADGGTLFLDEIGEMPLEMQPKLLRALEQKTVRPIGGKEERPFDVRLIAATNRDLEAAVEKKTFRQDLYYRINVLPLHVPPLRKRGIDILLLANYYLDKFNKSASKRIAGFDEQVSKKLLSYDWPGNVRELRNVIERAVILSGDGNIHLEAIPEKIGQFQPDKLVLVDDDQLPLEDLATVERRYIHYVLEKTGGNKTEAARILGLDRKTLYRKLKSDES